MQTSALKLERLREKYHTDSNYRVALLARRREHYALHRDEKITYARAWQKSNPEKRSEHLQNQKGAKGLLNGAKSRARNRGVPFNLELSDLVVPIFCPVLGIRLVAGKGKHSDNSPSLDRLVPHLGYVKGNISIISRRANRIKSDATAEEIEAVARWVRGNSLKPAAPMGSSLSSQPASK